MVEGGLGARVACARMDRRRFLTAVTAAVGGFALDPELALWRPGQRVHFDIAKPLPILWPSRTLEFINAAGKLDGVTVHYQGLDGVAGQWVTIRKGRPSEETVCLT